MVKIVEPHYKIDTAFRNDKCMLVDVLFDSDTWQKRRKKVFRNDKSFFSFRFPVVH